MRNNKYTLIEHPLLKREKIVCLTLDVEQDYGDLLEEPSFEGLNYIPEVVKFFKERKMPLTCFVQGSLFETHPDKIEQLAELDVEFELHSYSHPNPKKMNTELEVKKGKKAYQRFFGSNPLGYRAPLGFILEEDFRILASEGFKFDSSIFPSIRPGVFNNLRAPVQPYLLDDFNLVEFPITVLSNHIKIPIALSYIKLLGKLYFRILFSLPQPNLIIFNFHIHDLFELKTSTRLMLEKHPLIYRCIFNRIYKGSENGFVILDKLIKAWYEKGYEFWKLSELYKAIFG